MPRRGTGRTRSGAARRPARRTPGNASGPSSAVNRYGSSGSTTSSGRWPAARRPWAAGSARRVGVRVGDAEPAQHVAGERAAAEHHPGPAPDRHDRPAGRRRPSWPGGPGPPGRHQPVRLGGRRRRRASIRPAGRSASASVRGKVTQTGTPAARRASTSAQRFSSSLAGPGRAASARTRSRSGYLLPPTRATSSSGRVGAPVRRPDQQPGRAQRHRLGQRRDQRDHPHRPLPSAADPPRSCRTGVRRPAAGRRTSAPVPYPVPALASFYNVVILGCPPSRRSDDPRSPRRHRPGARHPAR